MASLSKVLMRTDQEQARLVNLRYKEAQCTGLSVTAVFHPSAQAFPLHPTESSNTAALISVCSTGVSLHRYYAIPSLIIFTTRKVGGNNCSSERVPDVC